ncbi:MAG: tetratricopeptide repeat protein, partial [Gemmatimonadetes bacterium]|nr:tetratricopeptide repeat protein [Gemmatimonadota bacterium]
MAEAQRDEIAKLEALYAANPEGHVFTHLAEAYRKAGELEHARDILAEGLRRHPDSASAHVVLGRVEHDRADNAAAQRAFGQVLALDPGNLIALRFLGDLALERGDRAEALGHYRELLNRDVSDPVLQQTVDELARFAEVEAAILTPAPATAAPATSAAETAPEQGDLTEPEEGDAAGAVPGEEAVLLAAEEQAVDAGAGPVPPEPVAFESPAPAEAAELAWFAPEEPVAPALPPLEDGPEPVLATFDVVAEPLPDLETWETGEPEFLSLEFPSPEAGDLEFLSVDTDAESPEGGELAFLSLEEDDGAGAPGEY